MNAERQLLAGQDYQMTIFVHNPTQYVINYQYSWVLETTASPADHAPYFRDKVTISGYAVNERLNSFEYLKADSANPPALYLDGLQLVPDLFFLMNFPRRLDNGDTIVLEAPDGFTMAGAGSGQCNNF